MTKMRKVRYSEFRAFLERVGYKERRIETAIVFTHPREGRLFFRVYKDNEVVHPRDLLSTRKFLEYWGLMDPADFDAQLLQPASRA